MECAICLKECVFPVNLPCKHVFCFLCAKGALSKRTTCPICRANVPVDYFDNPDLINKPEQMRAPVFDENYSWFYAGENGWWIYDEQHSSEIESCFKQGQQQLELLIAGHLYTIDLERMVQYRKRDQRRQRKIKRDLTSNASAKGWFICLLDSRSNRSISLILSSSSLTCPSHTGIAGIKLKLTDNCLS